MFGCIPLDGLLIAGSTVLVGKKNLEVRPIAVNKVRPRVSIFGRMIPDLYRPAALG